MRKPAAAAISATWGVAVGIGAAGFSDGMVCAVPATATTTTQQGGTR
jgi:hypothetical protein